jgi:glycosyltransferase involved in cell wall biosynthesis
LVSIIIPCYNAEEFVSQAIAGALNQTFTNIELIIINDGSTDNSENEILSFRDSRIRYFKQSNKGQAAVLNFGISEAKGNYIKFFDADDVMHPEHVEKMVKRLEGNDHSIAFCEWGAFENADFSSAKFSPLSNWKDMLPLDWLKIELKQYCDMLAGWRWLIPRILVEKAGGWDERLTLNNDFEFSIRLLLKADKMLFAEGAKMYYRWATPHAVSRKKTEKAFRDALLSTYLGCACLLDSENSEEIKTICRQRYEMWLTRIPEEYAELRMSFRSAFGGTGSGGRRNLKR